MPKGNAESLGGLLLDLAALAACGLVLAALSPPRRKGVRDERVLVSLDELSVADIHELPPGHVAPMSDRQNLALYHTGHLVECSGCDHQYYAGPANTHVIVYTLEPQYTHAQFSCPGDHDGYTRVLSMRDLMVYVQAGCRIIVRADRAEAAVRRIFAEEDGSEYTPDDATEEDHAIHAKGMDAAFDALRFDLDGLAQLEEDEDPVLALARQPTE